MSELYLLKEHREWIGLIQPVGLVVSPSALANAQLRIQKDVFNLQDTFRSITDEKGLLPLHLSSLFTRVLGWRSEDLVSGETVSSLDVFLPEREAFLKADYAVKNADSGKIDILIKHIDQLQFDEEEIPEGRGWQASPHAKFERHLREKNLSIGILINQSGLRLIYSPKGETSGYLTFPFAFMRETQGRPVLAALHLLLCEDRLFKGDPKQRLQNLLIESRKFQNEVSTKLSEQVLAALYELVRGLQEADEDARGKLLEDVLKRDKNEVYNSLLTVLLRTVFTLYAEDRDLLSSDPVFLNNYSINGLFARLREDASKHHDSMNLRYGAWAHLLSLFRLIYEGIDLETDSIPGRKGHLFDPDRFPFLEGRAKPEDPFKPPRISDGVVWRVLSNLMTLDGERISYRALDVEQIGSVYETVMGFQLEIATGPSIAIRPAKAHGAPVVIDLSEVIAIASAKRAAVFKELTDIKLEGRIVEAIKSAVTPDELVAAMGSKIADWATPTIVGVGKMILQPSDERRRSGSHYTPRALTAPIVSKALEPILLDLGEAPKPEQVLALKICDPAMGSGAFLVEACRQLSEILVKSWAIYRLDIRNEIPPDEDELLYARRMIAQRCLYGVDKNPMAVNLAKLSLWLATFAKQHEFTFLDHNLKCGDSLVGLSLPQILAATWENGPNQSLAHASIAQRLDRVREVRKVISSATDETPIDNLRLLKLEEDELLNDLRCVGDAVIYSFFSKDKPRPRKEELNRIHVIIEMWFASGLPFSHFDGLNRELLSLKVEHKLNPFHWECEFPEVFESVLEDERFGFDAFVGNPPFISGLKISETISLEYNSYLVHFYDGISKKTDLSAIFLRRQFDLVRNNGAVGNITTNTISQGDTREGGLEIIVGAGGVIYYAISNFDWPGDADVIAASVALSKGRTAVRPILDGIAMDYISPFLSADANINTKPNPIAKNVGLAFQGVNPYGKEFVIENDLFNRWLEVDSTCREVVRPTIGGQELNDLVTLNSPPRMLINFGEMNEQDAQKYSEPFNHLSNTAKVWRTALSEKQYPRLVHEWWKLWHARQGLFGAINSLLVNYCFVRARTSNNHIIRRIPASWHPLESVVVFVDDSWQTFAVLQSVFHEFWTRKFASTLKKDTRYVVKDCFNTFPFPDQYKANDELAVAGQEFHDLRDRICIQRRVGPTKIMALFNDPNCHDPDITTMRESYVTLNSIVQEAYGFSSEPLRFEYFETEQSTPGRQKYRFTLSPSNQNSILTFLIEANRALATDGIDLTEDEAEL